MNKGVEILLSRMDSHPQEFRWTFDYRGHSGGMWEDLVTPCICRAERMLGRIPPKQDALLRVIGPDKELPFLTDEEVLALYEKFIGIQSEAYTQAVMRKLLDDSSHTGDLF